MSTIHNLSQYRTYPLRDKYDSVINYEYH